MADLSLTPLLPAPWPLQLWEDRRIIISGLKGRHTVPSLHCTPMVSWSFATQRTSCCSDESSQRELTRKLCTMVPLPYHTCRAIPTLNLLSSPFTKTVITLGFSCWLSENPLSTELGGGNSVMRCHTYIPTWHACAHTHTKAKNRT